MKKILIFLLTAFTLMACEQWNSGSDAEGEKKSSELNRNSVSFSFSMPAFQQQILSKSQNSQTERSTSNYTIDQILSGELVVTNKTTSETKNYNWSIYLNESDFSVQSNKTIVLKNVARYDFQLTLTRGNQQYIGSVSDFNIVDGTNDVPMVIRPVIGDNVTDVNLLEKVGTIQFQYDKTELTRFTAPKLGIAIDGGAETIYAIDSATGLISNYLNLPEGEHKILLKFYDGDIQLAKSNPLQETFHVTLGSNILMDLIPLEGETSFTLTENGNDAKFKLNLPTALITEAGGTENLEAQMTIVGPKNPTRDILLSIGSTVDTTGDTIYFAETTLDNYHYDTVSYTVTFSDLSKTPKEELARCVQENITLTQAGSTTPCPITLQRTAIITGNLYGTLGINVFDSGNKPLAGVKIKANNQLIGITGTGTFGTPGYLKHRIVKGFHKITAEDIGTVETDVTVDALELKNIDLTLSQNLNWNYIDSGSGTGINKDTNQFGIQSQLTVFNNKLYAAWSEKSGTMNQARVAVYNNNDNSPSWQFIDGDGVNGINKDVGQHAYCIQLTVFNNKLYSIWHETDGGSNSQIRVAVYNGDDSDPSWSFVNGNGVNGINKDPSQIATLPQLTVSQNKLYATWRESNGSKDQMRVAVYNGNDFLPIWSFVDGDGANGINKDPGQSITLPQLTAHQNKLYAIWREWNGSQDQIRVALYNGNDSSPSWSFVDGNGINGINKNPAYAANYPQLATYNDKLYATWRESDGTLYRNHVAIYNGNDSSPEWKFVDFNSYDALGTDSHRAQLTVYNNRLHMIWDKVDQGQNWVQVAVYNGDDSDPYWRAVNGTGQTKINQDLGQYAAWAQLTEFNNKLYATWHESNGSVNQIRVIVASY